MISNRLQSLRVGPVLAEVAGLAAFACAIHALVLHFVFPGYYDPLWPHHSDFYAPLSMVHSQLSFVDCLKCPRPMGQIFFLAIGHLGLHGSILAAIAVVVCNCALAATILRRWTGIPLDTPFAIAYAIYVFLVFSHPFAYVWGPFDSHSQVSLFFALCAVWALIGLEPVTQVWALALFGVGALLSFFTKEAWFVSLMTCSFTWFIARRRRGVVKALLPGVIALSALAVAFSVNIANHSPFITNTNDATNPYHLVLKPSSLIPGWWTYVRVGLNPLTVAVLLVVCVAILWWRPISLRVTLVPALLPLAALGVLVPNAALPNHYYSGYSFNAAVLLFAPVVLAGTLVRYGGAARFLAGAIIAMAIASPLLSTRGYQENAWTLEQQARQRQLLTALEGLTTALPKDRKTRVLVSGIAFPFKPFDHGPAMKELTKDAPVDFDVIDYQAHEAYQPVLPRFEAKPMKVAFVSADEVKTADYSRVWEFRMDGTLAFEGTTPEEMVEQSQQWLTSRDYVVYPALRDLFPPGRTPDGGTYLECGGAMLTYHAFDKATRCLNEAISRLPGNPYPHYFLGLVHVAQGARDEARAQFEAAIAFDLPQSPNPAFRQQLENLNRIH